MHKIFTVENKIMKHWIDLTVNAPNFQLYGFHTGKKLWFRRNNGTEYLGIYLGWGIFSEGHGSEEFDDVTHWAPVKE